MKHASIVLAALAALAAMSLAAAPAAATVITAGNDDFTVLPTPSSSYDFSSSPIPAGFFDPGSEPFDGTVRLGGGDPGGVDTVVQRMSDMGLGPWPSGGTVPIEIVALNLVSCEPITVRYTTGPDVLWDVHVGLDPIPSTGGMGIQQTHANGGTFTSTLPVRPVFTFSRHDIPLVTTAPLLRPVTTTGFGTWSFTAPPGVLPSGNNFYPGGDPTNPLTLDSVHYSGGGLSLEMRLTETPEPATLTLLALGGLAVAGLAARRRRAA